MKYEIALRWSQGATEAEAVENIADAIGEYFAARDEMVGGHDR